MSRITYSASNAPQAIGPYSHAAGAPTSALVYLSGQTPIDPVSGSLVDGDVAAQTRQVFDNLATVLASAELSFADVIKVNVYLTSMQDFAAMNDVYGSVFSSPFPARTTVAVAELPLGANVEIEVVAARSE